MSRNWYPGASKTQTFFKRYTGSKMTTNCLILHSTESTGWPGYGGGSVAPNMTVRPAFGDERLDVRQHYRATRSARALQNHAGGVETNTLNCFQIEIVGTCDPATHRAWDAQGVDHLYMPELPDWAIRDLAKIVQWLDEEFDDFRIADGAPRGWPAYPGSYGYSASQRMSNKEWLTFYGIAGHMHVPENDHGDPGYFPISALVAAANGTPIKTKKPKKKPAKSSVKRDRMDASSYPSKADPNRNTHGPQIEWVGERMEAWGFDEFYNVGAGPKWSDHDRQNMAAFQRACGWTGSDADGYPGPVTLKKLARKPNVSLSKVRTAARKDGPRQQGGTTPGARLSVHVVERALLSEGLLAAKWAYDDSFGTVTVSAYSRWQQSLGYRGKDADGVPGKVSLKKLGSKHGFRVKK